MPKKVKRAPRRTLEINGETYSAPVVVVGSIVHKSDRRELVKLVCELYANPNHKSLSELCEKVGFSYSSFVRWKANLEDLEELFHESAAFRRAWINERTYHAVQVSVEKLIEGYEVPIRKEFYKVKDGEEVLVKVIETVKYIPPNVTLLLRYLENMMPEEFGRPNQTLPEANYQPSNVTIRVIGDTDVPTSEHDIVDLD